VRRRWNLAAGGTVEIIDAGSLLLIVPAGHRGHLLDELVSGDDHVDFVRSLADDPDLATT
jgi:hypothetical protein